LFQPAEPKLPPKRPIEHEINLIDPDKKYPYRTPKCPDALKEQLLDKIAKYEKAGWWVRSPAKNVSPLLCVFKTKKDSNKLRTVIDARARNDNTVKDATPFPDQETIREDVARAKYRSKIDLADAYEQIRIKAEHVPYSAFVTQYGTFVSMTMQQGDCNAPASFQRLMNYIFREIIGRYVHVYLDDIYIFSDSLEEHCDHLNTVFSILRSESLHVNPRKVDLFGEQLDVLGHLINDQGIHPDQDKLSQIRDWPTPRSTNAIQRFLGLVNYIASFVPVLTKSTTPLSLAGAADKFEWTPLLDNCFHRVKAIVAKSLVLTPIDVKKKEPIWVVCDASTSGVGAYYGQGSDWKSCKPAGFHSRKFSDAQRNYRTHEQELLAILEALMKWEDKLIGREFRVITDHKSLEFFHTQGQLSPRQSRWWEFMSRFSFKVEYVKGTTNTVADSLSRYYHEPRSQGINPFEFVHADRRLDPEGEDAPTSRWIELSAFNSCQSYEDTTPYLDRDSTPFVPTIRAITRAKAKLLDKEDRRRNEDDLNFDRPAHDTEDINDVADPSATDPPPDPTDDIQIAPQGTQIPTLVAEDDDDPLMVDSAVTREDLRPHIETGVDFAALCRAGYPEDPVLRLVINSPTAERKDRFKVENDLIYTKNRLGLWVVCVPKAITIDGRRVTETIIDQAHRVVGHFGRNKTYAYLQNYYWWPSMAVEVAAFCSSCVTCQRSKPRTGLPTGFLHSLPVPFRPWESIGIDFIGPLTESNGYNFLVVIIDRLTSLVHLIPCTTKLTATEFAKLFFANIVRLHGIPDSIISDRDTRFVSRFWRELTKLMGVKLLMSTAFHPQTDGATERCNRSVTQILRSIIDVDQTNWSEALPLVEFAINSSINASSGFAPFELNCGFLPRLSSINVKECKYEGVRHFAEQAKWNLIVAHDAIIAARLRSAPVYDAHRSPPHDFKRGQLVYLSTENLSLPRNRSRKLCPKFLGPFKILKLHPNSPTASLELPDDLRKRGIHNNFHVQLIRPHIPNDNNLFPNRLAASEYDFGAGTDEKYVDEIMDHRVVGRRLELLLLWTTGDQTWEPLSECSRLSALDDYLDLRGVTRPVDLRAIPSFSNSQSN
jgi:transposase InsO family protein